MLDNLTQRLTRVAKAMRGEACLTEANTAEMLCKVRLALLEADMALPVVREFIARVKEEALGEDVIVSLSPDQALIGIVQRELTAIIGGQEALEGVGSNIMGGRTAELNLNVTPPAIILMAGLQGADKTTIVGKLVKWLEEDKKKKVLTASCDMYRPTAITQLKTVSEQVGAGFFPSQPDQKPVDIAAAALDWAKKYYHDVLIVDTTGRLGIDETMMQEIAALHAKLKPAETLFAVDAMLGQDVVDTVKAFNDTLSLTGVVLTKLNSDTCGGAALSVCHIVGKPIKFVGVAEKPDGLEPFYLDRIAQRIPGMGDILALAEEIQRGVDMEEAQKLATKIKRTSGFDFKDFKAQIGQTKKMGGLGSLMGKLSAQLARQAQGANIDQAEKQVRRMEGIINSMTAVEHAKSELIKANRKRRIVAGADVQVQEANRLLNQFERMQGMMRKFRGGGMMKMMYAMGSMKGSMKGLSGSR